MRATMDLYYEDIRSMEVKAEASYRLVCSKKTTLKDLLRVIESKIVELKTWVVNAEMATTPKKVRVDEANFLYVECLVENTMLYSEVSRLQK